MSMANKGAGLLSSYIPFNEGNVLRINKYRSPNIIRVIKSRRLRCAGHVARMEVGRSAFKILTGKPTGKRDV